MFSLVLNIHIIILIFPNWFIFIFQLTFLSVVNRWNNSFLSWSYEL